MRFDQPLTVEAALDALASQPMPTVLAGGTDVMVQMRAGKRLPDGLVDVTRIPRLMEICLEGGRLFVGAAVSCTQLERNALVHQLCPLLAEAAGMVGSPQIRSRATVGGNAANASPAADLVPVLTVLDALAELHSQRGVRTLSMTELITGASRTTLQSDELIVGFRLVPIGAEDRWSYEKIGRRNALSISRLNGACVLHQQSGCMRQVRLCIGAVTDRPRRVTAAERLLEGCEPSEELFAQAGDLVRQEILEQTGARASGVYKLPVAAKMTARLLEQAWRDQHEN